MTELPDWTRGVVLVGHDGSTYRVLAVDTGGQLYVLTVGANEEGNPKVLACDDAGQLITVLRGKDGNYVSVDENGYLGVILKAAPDVNVPGSVTVDQNEKDREMKGADGETLRTVAVDANGQLIMVPRGQNGNYMDVDENGYLGVLIKATPDVNVAGSVAVDQNEKDREMKGSDGATLRTVAVDANGQLIMVPRGQNGNYMNVDPNGYLTTVIKGAYGGAFKTLATDDDGNMIALLKDTEDQWGQKVNVGIGELAARLGSPVNWERRGQVTRIMTFESGLSECLTEAFGTGSLVELCPETWQTGGYSCHLQTGEYTDSRADVSIYTDFSPSTTLGFEVAFSIGVKPAHLYFYFSVYDGSYEYRGWLHFVKAASEMRFYNSSAGWSTVDAFLPYEEDKLFYSVKGVIDIDSGMWKRVLLNGSEYDLSDKVLYKTSFGGSKYAWLCVSAVGNTLGVYHAYVDRMVITVNEP